MVDRDPSSGFGQALSKCALTPNDAGFTLVELLVVLLLAALIGAAVAAGLQFGTRVWEHSERNIARTQAYDTAQSILRELLASAMPRMKGGFAEFSGRPDSLEFDARPLAAFPRAGLAHVELSLVRDADGMRLVLKAAPLIDTRNGRVTILADHLNDLEFSYYDASEKAPVWLSFWRDRDRLPDAVRLEAVESARISPWPAFVVRLPIAQDANCIFDPVSMRCRSS